MVLVRSLYFSTVFALSGFVSPIGLNALTDVFGMRDGAVALAAALPSAPPATVAKPDIVEETVTTNGGGSKAVRLTRASDGLFYVRARVNDMPIRFVVDTGSSVMVLTKRDAAKLGIRPHSDDYDANVQTAGGDSAMAWTTLDHVQMAGRHVGKLRAVVVRDGLAVSLLGQNMLSRLGRVTIEGDSLTLR